MSTLVQKVDEVWNPVRTTTVVAPDGGKMARSEALRVIQRGDLETMRRFQIALALDEKPPEGMQVVRGTYRFEEQEGVPVRVADYEPIPAPGEITDAERLTLATGLTVDQIKTVLGLSTTVTEPRP